MGEVLEKQPRFINCKDCDYYNLGMKGCSKFSIESASELDGCTFGDEIDWLAYDPDDYW